MKPSADKNSPALQPSGSLMLRSLSRYAKLWLGFFKNSLIRQLEYKTNFIGQLITEVVWITTQLIFFKAIFLQVDSFAGWNESEIYFFVGSLYLVDGLHVTLISKNQNTFGSLIRNGLFDFYLLRPVSAYFMSLFRYVNIPGFVNLISAILIVAYSLSLDLSISAGAMALWLVHIFLGFMLLACLGSFACSMAFWATQVANLNWLFYELYRLGWRPESLYPNIVRRFLLGVFPAAFFISIPSQIALGKIDGLLWNLAPFGWVAIAALATNFVWRKGIVRYEGALS